MDAVHPGRLGLVGGPHLEADLFPSTRAHSRQGPGAGPPSRSTAPDTLNDAICVNGCSVLPLSITWTLNIQYP